MRSRQTVDDRARGTWGTVISLQPVQRLGLRAPAPTDDAIDMAVLGRFLTELSQRSQGGVVKIRAGTGGRAWRVSVMNRRLRRCTSSAPTLAEAFERALQRLLV
jgi:hypothetical protein